MIDDETLTAEEAARVFELLESPPAPTPKLIELMRGLKETAPMSEHKEQREVAWIHFNGEWHPTVVVDGIPLKVEVHRQIGVGPLADAWGPRVPEPPWPVPPPEDVDRPVDTRNEVAFLRGQWDAVRVDRERHVTRAWQAEQERNGYRDQVDALRVAMEMIVAGEGDAKTIAQLALRSTANPQNLLRSLSPEEQANVPPLTKEAVETAIARGRLDRLREEDAKYGTQNALFVRSNAALQKALDHFRERLAANDWESVTVDSSHLATAINPLLFLRGEVLYRIRSHVDKTTGWGPAWTHLKRWDLSDLVVLISSYLRDPEKS